MFTEFSLICSSKKIMNLFLPILATSSLSLFLYMSKKTNNATTEYIENAFEQYLKFCYPFNKTEQLNKLSEQEFEEIIKNFFKIETKV